jgi:hypothetical protein
LLREIFEEEMEEEDKRREKSAPFSFRQWTFSVLSFSRTFFPIYSARLGQDPAQRQVAQEQILNLEKDPNAVPTCW